MRGQKGRGEGKRKGEEGGGREGVGEGRVVPPHDLFARRPCVQQLNCCVKKCQTFLGPTCGLQTAHILVL